MTSLPPKTLPLPAAAYYPVLPTLQLFDRDTRATVTARNPGEQAPPFDPTRRIKRWADPRDYSNLGAGGLVEYNYFDEQAHVIKTMKLSQAEAGSFNLPGAYAYPKYQIAPTPAVWVHTGPGDSSITPYDASLLCTLDQATAIAKEIGGGAPAEAPVTLGQLRLEWNGETRRNWLIPYQGGHQQASLLLKAKNAQGVGAPGKWSGVTWIPETPNTGAQDPRPEIALPIRSLYPQEALAPNFGQPIVYRTDMDSPFNPKGAPATGGTGGGLTAAQAQMLSDINTNVFSLTQRA